MFFLARADCRMQMRHKFKLHQTSQSCTCITVMVKKGIFGCMQDFFLFLFSFNFLFSKIFTLKSINSNVYQCLHLLTNYYFFSFLLLIAGCPYPGITTTVKMSVPGQVVEKCQKPTITTTAEMFYLPLATATRRS